MVEATIEDSAWSESLFEGIRLQTDSEHVLSLLKLRKVAFTRHIEFSIEE